MKNETTAVTIRDCEPADLPGLARLAARLVREHHGMDPDRFFITEGIEEGYRSFLAKELGNTNAVVLAAVIREQVVGYAYGRIEPRDWALLRDRCGMFHDLYVHQEARRQGVGARLARAMIERLADLGAPRVILMTAAPNRPAQALFKRLGFRTTMLEMTKETPPSKGDEEGA